MEYWESCLGIDPNFPKYDSTYDRLKGYGFGEHFIEAEGTLGEIAKDVDRTFPQHILFEHRGGMGQDMLGNILKCFSEYAKLIGYCQVCLFAHAICFLSFSSLEYMIGNEFCRWNNGYCTLRSTYKRI